MCRLPFLYGGDMINTTNTSYDYLSEPVVEGGMINEQGVMNVALSFFDLQRHIEEDAGEKEVILFKQKLPIAKAFCASMSDWSFLMDTIEYDETDIYNDEPVPADQYVEKAGKVKGNMYTNGDSVFYHVYSPYKGFTFGYRLPSDCLKIKYIDSDVRVGFATKGRVMYCNFSGITLDYISDKMNNIPVEFGYLVAYRCAIEMAHHLDPEGTAYQRATNSLQQVFTVLKQKDDDSFKLQNPPQNYFTDIDSSYWGYKA